jgi:predicted PurR-regulated permease PerM
MKRNEYNKYLALGFILIVGAGLAYMLWGYVRAIISALIFVYLSVPLYLKLQRAVKNNSVAAALTILTIFLIALIPILTLAGIAINQASGFVNTIRVEDFTRFFGHLLPAQINIKSLLLRLAGDLASGLQNSVPSLVSTASHFFISLFIMIFLMYYIFINLHVFIARLVDLLPFSQENSMRFMSEFENVTKAIVLGQLVVALVQGLCGGLGFLIFRIDGAVLWGLVMTFLSFIPLFGSGLIWLPAGIIQLIQRDYFSGIGILLWGALVISNIDNVIRPRLVQKRTNVNPVITMVGAFIGLDFFGIIGIVVGPLILALFFVLVQMFRQEYIGSGSARLENP